MPRWKPQATSHEGHWSRHKARRPVSRPPQWPLQLSNSKFNATPLATNCELNDRTDQALGVAGALLDMLRDRSAATDKLDDVASGYSDALTQLLTPHKPRSNGQA